MKIKEFFRRPGPVISFEFFPPKTDDGVKNLFSTVESLKILRPSFVTMTYGAGGSTRRKTVELVSHIKNVIGLEAAAHLTCVGHTQEEIESVLKELEKAGIENIMALRGDPPQGEKEFVPIKNGFRYASELVRFIKSRFDFCLGVAGYPEKHIEAPSMEEDLFHLKEKVDAGGDVIVTQLFFDNADYFSFVDRVRRLGIKAPVVPGIMPIKDVDQIKRFTKMCGAKIPEPLLKSLESVRESPGDVVKIGVEHATAQCEELLAKGAPGIHFYTLNRSTSTREIFEKLKARGFMEATA